MIYNTCKINVILPNTKSKYVNFEEYTEQINKTIRYKQFTDPGEDFMNLIKTLYELDDNTYEEILKTYKYTEYNICKKNANHINRLISGSTDIVKDLGLLLNIISIKNSIINGIVIKSFNNSLSYDDMSKVADELVFNEGTGIKLFRSEFNKRIEKFDTSSIKFYLDSLTDDIIVLYFVDTIKVRIRDKRALPNKRSAYVDRNYQMNVRSKEIKRYS